MNDIDKVFELTEDELKEMFSKLSLLEVENLLKKAKEADEND